MTTNIIRLMAYLSIVLMIATGCQDQTDVYKEFVVPGGHVYPGLLVDNKVHSGNYRVQIVGLKPMGAGVNEIRVFWNYFSDSVSFKINKDTPKNLTLEIPGLEEKSYLFTLRTYNDNGDVSVPLEFFGKTYGAKYVATLANRSFSRVGYNDQAILQFDFGEAFEGALFSNIFYTNNNNEAVSLRVPTNLSVVVIADLNVVKPIQYITAYKPDTTCIDTFYCARSANLKIERAKMKVIAFSSENSNAANLRAADVVDGNPATRWHTKVGQNYPHFVTVDMIMPTTVNAFEIFCHTAGENAYNRAPNKFKLEISLDNAIWTNLGTFSLDRFDYSGGQMFYIPGNQMARYFRFTGLEGPDKNMVLGEIDVHSGITAEEGSFYGTWESTYGGVKHTVTFKNKYGYHVQDAAAAVRMNWSVANGTLSADFVPGNKSFSFSGDGKQLTIEGVGVFNKIK